MHRTTPSALPPPCPLAITPPALPALGLDLPAQCRACNPAPAQQIPLIAIAGYAHRALLRHQHIRQPRPVKIPDGVAGGVGGRIGRVSVDCAGVQILDPIQQNAGVNAFKPDSPQPAGSAVNFVTGVVGDGAYGRIEPPLPATHSGVIGLDYALVDRYAIWNANARRIGGRLSSSTAVSARWYSTRDLGVISTGHPNSSGWSRTTRHQLIARRLRSFSASGLPGGRANKNAGHSGERFDIAGIAILRQMRGDPFRYPVAPLAAEVGQGSIIP